LVPLYAKSETLNYNRPTNQKIIVDEEDRIEGFTIYEKRDNWNVQTTVPWKDDKFAESVFDDLPKKTNTPTAFTAPHKNEEEAVCENENNPKPDNSSSR
jgi:hypothetical protein